MKNAIIILLLFFVGIDQSVIIVPTVPQRGPTVQTDDDDDDDPGNSHNAIPQPKYYHPHILWDAAPQDRPVATGQRQDHEANSGLIAFLSLKANKESQMIRPYLTAGYGSIPYFLR